MLKIGVIGCGARACGILESIKIFDIPYRAAAIVDPQIEEIRKADHAWLEGCEYFESADDMLAQAELDGILIATRCLLHTEMACKAAARKLPIYLEKPVAITFEQVRQLADAFENYPAPVVVSFPLRLTPVVQRVRELIEQDAIGEVAHVAAFNDVPYGRCYYNRWYRNYDEMGGMFLQKATHDFDYMRYLVGWRPEWVCATKSQRIYGGDMPHELRCRDCDRIRTCPESSFNLFYETFNHTDAQPKEDDWCVYSREIRNEDSGNAILEYDNGLQASYTQNFFARHKAARRGARLSGFKGTIEFDWYQNAIKVFSHRQPRVETIEFTGAMSHFGGDRELTYDFMMAMAEGRPSRSEISEGIESSLTCLWARQSAETRQFCHIEMPT